MSSQAIGVGRDACDFAAEELDLSGDILIVDDDAGAARLLAMLVRHLGCNASFVESGGAALSYLAQHRPDLVILDLMMPGIDGLEVLRRMRHDPQTAQVPVVMFSALDDPHFLNKAMFFGANDYWVKASLDFNTLGARLAKFLEDKSQN